MSGEVSDLIIRWWSKICLPDIWAHSLAVNLTILQHSHKQLISLCIGHRAKWEHIDLINYSYTHTHTHNAIALRRNAALLPPAYDFGIGIGGSSDDGGGGGGSTSRHIGGGISQRHLHFLRTLNGQLTLIPDFIWLLLRFAADLTLQH